MCVCVCVCVGGGGGGQVEGVSLRVLLTFINISVPAIQPGSIHCSGDNEKALQSVIILT